VDEIHRVSNDLFATPEPPDWRTLTLLAFQSDLSKRPELVIKYSLKALIALGPTDGTAKDADRRCKTYTNLIEAHALVLERALEIGQPVNNRRRLKELERVVSELLVFSKRAYGQGSYWQAVSLHSAGRGMAWLNQPKRQRKLLRQSLEIFDTLDHEPNMDSALVRIDLATTAGRNGEHQIASEEASRVIALLREIGDDCHAYQRVSLLIQAGTCLLNAGRPRDAIRAIDQALETIHKTREIESRSENGANDTFAEWEEECRELRLEALLLLDSQEHEPVHESNRSAESTRRARTLVHSPAHQFDENRSQFPGIQHQTEFVQRGPVLSADLMRRNVQPSRDFIQGTVFHDPEVEDLARESRLRSQGHNQSRGLLTHHHCGFDVILAIDRVVGSRRLACRVAPGGGVEST
jgi:tetratricopeptide (TPR) repeat protein